MARVAIVAGCRTPFVRAAGVFSKYSFLDLGIHAVKSLVSKSAIDPEMIDELVFGTVLLDPRYPNYAREVVLRSGLPKTISAHAISNNCISGLVAANCVRESILAGRIRCGIAAGAESMSRPALTLHPKAEAFWLNLARSKTLPQRLAQLIKFKLKYAMPLPPSPKEPTTGLTMGQHCEITTQELAIDRKLQDEIAYNSHANASKAQAAGIFSKEIVELAGVTADNLIRADTTVEKLAKLKPVFDRGPKGTLTAGNSSALTDGASALCLMSEEFAQQNKFEILGFIEAIRFAAIDPVHGLLMAPCLAVPALMQQVGLGIQDIDLFEIHEAFAAQVAANILVWEKGWNKYPSLKPIGSIPPEKLNVNGGSIALGHPFAATGGRLLLSSVNELKRRQQKRALISVCAAGAMACAVLVSREGV